MLPEASTLDAEAGFVQAGAVLFRPQKGAARVVLGDKNVSAAELSVSELAFRDARYVNVSSRVGSEFCRLIEQRTALRASPNDVPLWIEFCHEEVLLVELRRMLAY